MNDNHMSAIIVSLSPDVSEIIQLAETLDYCVCQIFFQQRNAPDANFYVGSGKVEEIGDYLNKSEENVKLVIVNGELKPSQWFILEKKLGVLVYDRIRLILAIFEQRAERKEARLQVKLAQLRYERPYVRELIHRARSGEHPGFMAGGEYQVDDYYEMIKKQMKKSRYELAKIQKNRELHRDTRHKLGFYLVSLAGYTNAGKSSLLNLLSKEFVRVEGKLFSTLSTTTRRVKKQSENHIPILLTDTVGFIKDLPSWIIDAFHSTLEEIEVADVVVLVADGSERRELVGQKLQISLYELHELGVTASILIALNKIDKLCPDEISRLLQYLSKMKLFENSICIPISVIHKKNINLLINTIQALLPHIVKMTIKVPLNERSQAFISWLYTNTNVVQINYKQTISIVVECNEKLKHKIQKKTEELEGILFIKK
jgi:GTP-binding protein HflX